MKIKCYNPQLTEGDKLELVEGLSEHSLRIHFETSFDKYSFVEQVQSSGFTLSGMSGEGSDGGWADVYIGNITEYNSLSEYLNKYYDVEVIPSTEYTLSYEVDDEVIETIKLISGKKIDEKVMPERQGYKFVWNNPIKWMQSMDYTIKGTYTPNMHTITYLIDGSQYNTQNVAYGESITPIDDPIKPGYEFSGWSQLPATMPDNDLTCTGSMTPIDLTLTYESAGETYTTQTYHAGDTITKPEDPTREGYEFLGWFNLPETMPAENITVKAIWSSI